MIGIGLHIQNSLEAVEPYKKAFGLELGYHVLNTNGKGYFLPPEDFIPEDYR